MAVTTTESLDRAPSVRCGKCGKLARGGILIGGLAECHASKADLKLLQAMVGDAPAEEEPEPVSHVGLGFALGLHGLRAGMSSMKPNPQLPVETHEVIEAVPGEDGQTGPQRAKFAGPFTPTAPLPDQSGFRPIQSRLGRH